MKKTYFITGTDTEVGKTTVTAAILDLASQEGIATLGLKPVAAGAEMYDGELRNEDAIKLMANSSVRLPYQSVNPICLQEPIAPHIAAVKENRRVSVQSITGFCRGAMMTSNAQLTLIEGAGGWLVPLNTRETMADLAKQLNVPVILVVGMKLGCLNHALLTARAVLADGLPLAGWIANLLDPDMAELGSNIQTLEHRIPAPLLGVLPNLSTDSKLSNDWLDLTRLTKN